MAAKKYTIEYACTNFHRPGGPVVETKKAVLEISDQRMDAWKKGWATGHYGMMTAAQAYEDMSSNGRVEKILHVYEQGSVMTDDG